LNKYWRFISFIGVVFISVQVYAASNDYTVRMHNVDDLATLYINGELLYKAQWGYYGTEPDWEYIAHQPGDSGEIDITSDLVTGDNSLRFTLWNEQICCYTSLSIDVKENGVLIFSDSIYESDSSSGIKYDNTINITIAEPTTTTTTTTVESTTTTTVSDSTIPEFPWFSQIDKWKLDPMGNNTNCNIGNAGCAMTCIAMLHKAETGGYNPGPIDPRILNTFLNEKNGYGESGCIIEWETADRWDDEFSEQLNGDGLEWVELHKTSSKYCEDNWEYLDEQLAQGRKIVVKVNPDLEPHWVLVYKREGNSGNPRSYYINDPILEEYEIRTLQYYNNKHPENTFIACCTYEGEEWLTNTTSSTTTTTKCPPKKIYGEDSEEVELLGYLRDNVLKQTPEGGELIKLYYQWSPVIVKAMEKDEEFKAEVKEMIDRVLGLVEEGTE